MVPGRGFLCARHGPAVARRARQRDRSVGPEKVFGVRRSPARKRQHPKVRPRDVRRCAPRQRGGTVSARRARSRRCGGGRLDAAPRSGRRSSLANCHHRERDALQSLEPRRVRSRVVSSYGLKKDWIHGNVQRTTGCASYGASDGGLVRELLPLQARNTATRRTGSSRSAKTMSLTRTKPPSGATASTASMRNHHGGPGRTWTSSDQPTPRVFFEGEL